MSAQIIELPHPVFVYKTGESQGKNVMQRYAHVSIDKVDWSKVSFKTLESKTKTPEPVMQYTVDGKAYDILFKTFAIADMGVSYYPSPLTAKDPITRDVLKKEEREKWNDTEFWNMKAWSLTVNLQRSYMETDKSRPSFGELFDKFLINPENQGDENTLFGVWANYLYDNYKKFFPTSKKVSTKNAFYEVFSNNFPIKENQWVDKNQVEHEDRRCRLKFRASKTREEFENKSTTAKPSIPILSLQQIKTESVQDANGNTVERKYPQVLDVDNFTVLRDAIRRGAKCVISWYPSFYKMNTGQYGLSFCVRNICVSNPIYIAPETKPVVNDEDVESLTVSTGELTTADESAPNIVSYTEDTVDVIDEEVIEEETVEEEVVEEEQEPEGEPEEEPEPEPVKKIVGKKPRTPATRK